MEDGTTTRLGNVIRIDRQQLEARPSENVRGSVEETLKGILDAEAQQLCGAERFERTEKRKGYLSGHDDPEPKTET